MVKYQMKITGFGKRLKKAREDKCLTQMQIAKLLETDQRVYSPWEAGKEGKQIEPSYDMLSRISDILGVSIDWLVRGSTTEEIKTSEKVTDKQLRQKQIGLQKRFGEPKKKKTA